jgi:hypothetical protein
VKKALVIAAGLAVISSAALAQNYPTRPISMIVPFAAGGPTDVIARIVADPMSRILGQQVVVENVAGAGGTTGITRGATAKPDGYTIMMGHMGTHGVAPALYPNLKYNPSTDFTPIGLAAGTPIIIVAKKNDPRQGFEGIHRVGAKEGSKVNQAYAGNASVSHTTGILLGTMMPWRITDPRALHRHRPGAERPDLRPGRLHDRPDRQCRFADQGRIDQGFRHRARRPVRPPCPTCRPRRKPACRSTKSAPGTRFSRPRACPPISQPSFRTPCPQALDDANARKRLGELGGVIPGADGRGGPACRSWSTASWRAGCRPSRRRWRSQEVSFRNDLSEHIDGGRFARRFFIDAYDEFRLDRANERIKTAQLRRRRP